MPKKTAKKKTVRKKSVKKQPTFEKKSDRVLKFIFLFLLSSVIGRIYEFDLTLSSGSLNYLAHFPTARYTLIFAFPYGIAGLLLYLTARTMDRWSITSNPVLKVIACVAVIDIVELVIGLITVSILDTMPWDYTHHMWNYRGLISLPITIRWALFVVILGSFAYRKVLEFLAAPLSDRIRKLTKSVGLGYLIYLVLVIILGITG